MNSAKASDEKMQQVLAAAAHEFNARGISGAALGSISKAVGLSRSTVYYYFENRVDLAYKTYLHSCEVSAQYLKQAAQEPRGLERVKAFAGLSLTAERGVIASLTEVPSLQGDQREDIEQRIAVNASELQNFIVQGIADGSIRACNADVLSHVLLGILDWLPMSTHWIWNVSNVHLGTDNLASEITDLIDRGMAARRLPLVRNQANAEQFALQPDRVFDKTQAHQHRIDNIARAASNLFNRRGVAGPTIEQIATELGATTGVLYHYVKDKKQLIELCYERSFRLYDEFFAAAQARGKNSLEIVLIGLHLNVQAQASRLNPLSPLVGSGIESLGAGPRRRLREHAAVIEANYENAITAGIADRSIRSCAPRAVTACSVGSYGWLANGVGARVLGGDPRDFADEITALFQNGLRTIDDESGCKQAGEGADAPGV